MGENQIVNMSSGHRLSIPVVKMDSGRPLMVMEAALAITVGLEWVLLKLVAIACRTLLWSLAPIIALASHIEARGRPLALPSVSRRGVPFIVMIPVRVERRLCKDCPPRRVLFVPLASGSGWGQEG